MFPQPPMTWKDPVWREYDTPGSDCTASTTLQDSRGTHCRLFPMSFTVANTERLYQSFPSLRGDRPGPFPGVSGMCCCQRQQLCRHRGKAGASADLEDEKVSFRHKAEGAAAVQDGASGRDGQADARGLHPQQWNHPVPTSQKRDSFCHLLERGVHILFAEPAFIKAHSLCRCYGCVGLAHLCAHGGLPAEACHVAAFLGTHYLSASTFHMTEAGFLL